MTSSSYMADYMRQRRKNRRLKFIKLLGNKCVNCGEDDPSLLQFDHQNPKKKEFDLNDIKDSNEQLILKELKKCVLLCVECHLEKTKTNKEHVNKDKKPSRHGKLWHYKNYGCRCAKCRQAARVYYLNKKR